MAATTFAVNMTKEQIAAEAKANVEAYAFHLAKLRKRKNSTDYLVTPATPAAPTQQKQQAPLWERIRNFFIPAKFEREDADKKTILLEMLEENEYERLFPRPFTQTCATHVGNFTFFDSQHSEEDRAFLKEAVAAYLRELYPDQETLEQRARVNWIAHKNTLLQAHYDDLDAKRQKGDALLSVELNALNDKARKGKYWVAKERELFFQLLDREREFAKSNRKNTPTDQKVNLEILKAQLAISQARSSLSDRQLALLELAKYAMDLTLQNEKNEINKREKKEVNKTGKRVIYGLGLLFSVIYSLGCGVTTAGAFLIVFSGGAAIPLVVAIFLAGTIINLTFTYNSTPQVFLDKFGFGSLWRTFKAWKKGDLKDKLPGLIVALKIGGILLALGTGFTTGILTFTGAAAIFGGISAVPLIMLAVISGICIATVMIRGINKALDDNPVEKIKAFFKNFVKHHMVKKYDKNGLYLGEVEESRLRRAMRIGFVVLFFAAFFAIAVLGCMLNMFSAHINMVNIFWKVNHAALRICQIMSIVIASLSIAGELQLHFDTAKKAAKAFINPLFKLWDYIRLLVANQLFANKKNVAIVVLSSIIFIPILIINMIGNGMIAGMGSASNPEALKFSATIAAFESFIDTFRDYLEFMLDFIKNRMKNVAFEMRQWLIDALTFLSNALKKPGAGAGSQPPAPPPSGDNAQVVYEHTSIQPSADDQIIDLTVSPDAPAAAAGEGAASGHAVEPASSVSYVLCTMKEALSLMKPPPKEEAVCPTPLREDVREDALPRVSETKQTLFAASCKASAALVAQRYEPIRDIEPTPIAVASC